MIFIFFLFLILWLLGIEPAHAQLAGGVVQNALSSGVSDLGGGLFGGLLGGGLGLLGGLSGLIGGSSSASAGGSTFLPTVTQSGGTDPFDITLNLSQIGGPGGAASASSSGGLFPGISIAKGGAGGGNNAIVDPTITQEYAPPNYSIPMAGFLSDLGAGGEPFGALPTTQASPNTFNPGMISSPLQGGVGMNMPASAGGFPSPLSALLGGNLAPNSGAAPLAPEQSSPVSQALSALMPQGAQQGSAPSGAPPPPGGVGMGFPPNLSAFMLSSGQNGGPDGTPPQQGGAPLQSQQAQMDTSNDQNAGPTKPAPPVQGGLEQSPIYSMPKLGRQQQLQEHATNAMRDLDDIQNEMEKKIKDADSVGEADKDEGELAGLNADEAAEDLKKDRYKAAHIGGHKHPYLRALGAVGMAFQPQSTVANYINQDAQRKFEAAKFNAEEQYKEARLNADVDKALLSQNRLREQAAKTRAALAQHRAKTEAMTEAQKKIDAVKESLSAENIGAKNELENAKAQIEVTKLEEQQKMNNSLIAYRKAEIQTARANAAAHQQIANADSMRAAASAREFSPQAMETLIKERMAHTQLYNQQTKQAASYNILGQLIKEGKISKAQANQYMDNMMGQ
jgi:hypothetical protein